MWADATMQSAQGHCRNNSSIEKPHDGQLLLPWAVWLDLGSLSNTSALYPVWAGQEAFNRQKWGKLMCFMAGGLHFPRQAHQDRSQACSDKLSMFVVTGDHSRMEKGLCLCIGYKASQIISAMGFSLAPHGKGRLHLTDERTGLPRVWWVRSPTWVLLPLSYH